MRPNAVTGTASGARSCAIPASLASNSPVTGETWYPPSVTVSETIRVSGSAIFSMTASGSSGASSSSTIEPTTRGSSRPSGCLRTRVYSPSWLRRPSISGRSEGSTPTPQIPQVTSPAASSRSTYIASWARWKPPTPTWTIPTATRDRSYPGTGTREASSVRVAVSRLTAVPTPVT